MSLSRRDPGQIIKLIYDEVTASLRITTPSAQEVSINSIDDSIAIADSTGNPLVINTDGSINSKLSSLATFQTSQYSVGTSPVQLTVSPLANRKAIAIKVITTSSSDVVYVGNSNAVTSNSGYFLFNGDAVQLDITPAQAIWTIGTSTGQKVCVIEIGG